MNGVKCQIHVLDVLNGLVVFVISIKWHECHKPLNFDLFFFFHMHYITLYTEHKVSLKSHLAAAEHMCGQISSPGTWSVQDIIAVFIYLFI